MVRRPFRLTARLVGTAAVSALQGQAYQVPVVGTFAVFGLGIFRLVKECQWISRKDGGGLAYVSLFLFPVALPYIMMKQYD